jgi:hypothetical protein
MATAMDEARKLIDAPKVEQPLACAPHIMLSPTYREMHRRVDGSR